MVVALDEADPAIAAAAVVGHLGGVVVEMEEHAEHMSFEAENGETADEGHTAAAAAVAAAEVGYKLEEHNWDDSSEQTTEWELVVDAAVAAGDDEAADDAVAHATVAQDSRWEKFE
jgi:hypothetical protein